MKKNKNFWANVPELTEKELNRDLKDLGYDPLEQTPVGREKLKK